MINISADKIPKGIMLQLSYMFFYSFLSYVFLLFLFTGASSFWWWWQPLTDYQLFVWTLLFAVPFWIILSFWITPIEKRIIKRNIFVAGLIQVLKNHKSIKFSDIIDNYSYFVFQSKKVMALDYEWAIYIEALIALWVIRVKNEKKLKLKDKSLDYKHFYKNLFDVELELKDKKINVDELIKRLDNYVL